MAEKSMDRRNFLKFAGASVGGAVLSACQVAQVRASSGGDDAGGDFSMLYDATICVGCKACQNACRDANGKPVEVDPSGKYDAPQDLSGDTWTLIQLYQDGPAHSTGSGRAWSFVKKQCMHCLDPACVAACPLSALKKTENGPVTYDTNICFGCRYCMVACPFGVPKYQWGRTTPYIQKCDFCVSNGRLPGGEGPACVEACPTGALAWGSRDEMLKVSHARIDANPDKYVDHVYGEHEAGGALALYLSGEAFEKLGFPTLDSAPLPDRSFAALEVGVPGIIVGMTALTAGIRWYTGRREENEKEAQE